MPRPQNRRAIEAPDVPPAVAEFPATPDSQGERPLRQALAPLPGAAVDECEDDDDAGEGEDDADIDVRVLAAVDVVRTPAHRPATSVRGYKPGTRQAEPTSTITGDHPWWSAPRGAAVWDEKAEEFKRKNKGGTGDHNLIGVKGLGAFA